MEKEKRESASGIKSLEVFEDWMETMTDDDYRDIVYRGNLSRGELEKLTGLSKSVFNQNKNVSDALTMLHDCLRRRGVLPQKTEQAKTDEKKPKLFDQTATQRAQDANKASKLEQENLELKTKIAVLEGKLSNLGRYQELSEIMVEMLEDAIDD